MLWVRGDDAVTTAHRKSALGIWRMDGSIGEWVDKGSCREEETEYLFSLAAALAEFVSPLKIDVGLRWRLERDLTRLTRDQMRPSNPNVATSPPPLKMSLHVMQKSCKRSGKQFAWSIVNGLNFISVKKSSFLIERIKSKKQQREENPFFHSHQKRSNLSVRKP